MDAGIEPHYRSGHDCEGPRGTNRDGTYDRVIEIGSAPPSRGHADDPSNVGRGARGRSGDEQDGADGAEEGQDDRHAPDRGPRGAGAHAERRLPGKGFPRPSAVLFLRSIYYPNGTVIVRDSNFETG